jgi:hypothetical protein
MPVISAHRWLRQVNPKLEASLGLRNKTLSKKKKNQFNGFDSSRIKGWSIFGLLITSHSSQLHLFWSRLSTVLWESDFHAQVGWGALPSSRFHSLSCISHPTVFPTALTPQDFNSGVPLIATPVSQRTNKAAQEMLKHHKIRPWKYAREKCKTSVACLWWMRPGPH